MNRVKIKDGEVYLLDSAGKVACHVMPTGEAQGLRVEHGSGHWVPLTKAQSEKATELHVEPGWRKVLEGEQGTP